mgnify:FL=1
MKYVDGYVLVVPKKNFNKYKKMASEGGKIWKKYGVLGYFECDWRWFKSWHGGMKMLGFQKMTKLKKNESVWFSFIIYKNKKHRDRVNKKIRDYFAKKYPDHKHEDMPWSMKRFSYGGFKAVVEK